MKNLKLPPPPDPLVCLTKILYRNVNSHLVSDMARLPVSRFISLGLLLDGLQTLITFTLQKNSLWWSVEQHPLLFWLWYLNATGFKRPQSCRLAAVTISQCFPGLPHLSPPPLPSGFKEGWLQRLIIFPPSSLGTKSQILPSVLSCYCQLSTTWGELSWLAYNHWSFSSICYNIPASFLKQEMPTFSFYRAKQWISYYSALIESSANPQKGSIHSHHSDETKGTFQKWPIIHSVLVHRLTDRQTKANSTFQPMLKWAQKQSLPQRSSWFEFTRGI